MIQHSKWQINPKVPQQGRIIDRILAGRGFVTDAQKSAFLYGSATDLHDPFDLPDMSVACDILFNERDAGREVIIHGDYDTDGLTATALLVKSFAALGIRSVPLIPDRMTDGYGISLAEVSDKLNSNRKLLVTVDCGIANIDEVAALKELGAGIIITDHHECPQQLPAADAIINPKRADSRYPFRHLAGVGVAYKLVQALCLRENIGDLGQEMMDLVALGTIADIVPLLGENRIMARLGLEIMNRQPCTGLKALMEKINGQNKTITSRTVGYQISPRINAAGRIGKADTALQLLLAKTNTEAREQADLLCSYNQERLELESSVLRQAEAQLDKDHEISQQKIIVVCGKNWHQGVLGIIAARLAERRLLPAIVLTVDEDNCCKGSARSWAGFDMYSALDQAKEHLLQFGGHSKAAGLSLKKEQLDGFITSVRNYAAQYFDPGSAPVTMAELQLTPPYINLDLVSELQLLEPFGEGNPQPLLTSSGLLLRSIRCVGAGKHIKVSLSGGKAVLDGIGFGMGKLEKSYRPGHRVDALYTLEVNSWMGIDTVQLNLQDLRPSITEGAGNDG